ncbi:MULTISPECIES: RNA 3'-terminal phosphate cyclase [unclassified Microbulbifer]|uniref:RNA 3'-terminal phosphate cyclase n=1 Tax=unclassified Microbulbifer TaxID=2619833 RepID=UPI0027E42928|nr:MULTISPECIES: RNA 3'-terminal phosphate cyclase [unclassified Microbulbifer]
MNWFAIDGSFGEGGGQLSRYAVALAAISGRPLHLRNIRARRAKPGLMAQHLTALRAAAEVGGGALEGAELGATEIYYEPGRIRGGEYHFDVGTAGSIVLVLQALLPVALHADGPVHLSITGGTDVRMAPPVDYLRLVFLPWLARMGVRVHVESVRHGYYPKGGGLVQMRVEPCSAPWPLLAEAPGALLRISGVSHVAHLPLHIPERMAAAARSVLADFDVQIETRVLGDTEAFGTGGALVLTAETENSVLGAATVAERGVPAERLGEDAGYALRAELEAGAAIDIHACDQLLIYAAQAQGTSRFAVRKVSEHTRTVMWLVEQFLPVRFSVEPWQGLYRIEVASTLLS